jgi:DNA-binding NtrC family response regulator
MKDAIGCDGTHAADAKSMNVLHPIPPELTHRVLPAPRKRVVVIEDDRDMRDTVVRALRLDGYDVVSAGDGVRAAAVLRQLLQGDHHGIDLVVTDIRMPRGNGLELLESIRIVDDDLPVVVMTGFGDSEVERRASDLGAFFLDKPFDVDDLRRLARRLLED